MHSFQGAGLTDTEAGKSGSPHPSYHGGGVKGKWVNGSGRVVPYSSYQKRPVQCGLKLAYAHRLRYVLVSEDSGFQ